MSNDVIDDRHFPKQFKWWWRRKTKDREYDSEFYVIDVNPGSKGIRWKRRKERGAQKYELARRFKREEKWAPYSASNTSTHLLEEDIEFDKPPAFIHPSESLSGFAEGFGKIPDVLWNLRLGDRAITKAFIGLIDAERKKRKIKRTQGPLGFKNRDVSWRPVELLDIADFKIRRLTRAEGEALRGARGLSRECYEHYHALLRAAARAMPQQG